MSYTVYSTKHYDIISRHDTERGAKIAKSRKFKNDADVVVLPISEAIEHMKTVPMKTVINLMTGKEVEIPANTPYYLDPSKETYWSR